MSSQTELCYVSDPDLTELDTNVVAVEDVDGAASLTLDRTPFYPQGGGQPSDIGVISGSGYSFRVDKAALVDGVVHHLGEPIAGTPISGPAIARIDDAIRNQNARLHTAGHLVMTAMFELTGLRAVKGYHFPNGPYVEFEGVLTDDQKATMAEQLQRRLDAMVAEDAPIMVQTTSIEELKARGVFIPGEIPSGKPTRVVTTYGYESPCGGTHVARAGALLGLRVRSVKSKSGRTRVSYEFPAAG